MKKISLYSTGKEVISILNEIVVNINNIFNIKLKVCFYPNNFDDYLNSKDYKILIKLNVLINDINKIIKFVNGVYKTKFELINNKTKTKNGVKILNNIIDLLNKEQKLRLQ